MLPQEKGQSAEWMLPGPEETLLQMHGQNALRGVEESDSLATVA